MKQTVVYGFLLILSAPQVAWAQQQNVDKVVKTGSRFEADREDQLVVNIDNEITTTIKLPSITLSNCEASITLGYHQRNTIARVEGYVEHKACAAGETASGEYEFAVSLRDAQQQNQTLQFKETWQQRADNKVSFSHDYAIGADVELLRVRVRRSKCSCELAAQ